MPASPNQCGARRVGFTPPIHAGGSSGIAAIMWAGCRKKMPGRSHDGRPFAATRRRSDAIASPAIRPAARDSGKHCCIGPMTAGKSEYCHGPLRSKSVAIMKRRPASHWPCWRAMPNLPDLAKQLSASLRNIGPTSPTRDLDGSLARICPERFAVSETTILPVVRCAASLVFNLVCN